MKSMARKWIERLRRRRVRRVEAPRNGRNRDTPVEELIRYMTHMYLFSSNAPLIRFFDEDGRKKR